MTSDEFRALLQQQTDSQMLDSCLYDDHAPYVFDPRPAAWDSFRDELVLHLDVSRSDIRLVGSGRFGFSLKPGYGLKTFSDTSDIDIVVVNAALFDEIWLALLEAAYPRPPVETRIGGWLKARRNELYTGWITPVDIQLDLSIVGRKARPVLALRTRWFNALKRAGQYPPRRHEGVTGRLYRTWRHAELYHLDSIAALRRTLLEGGSL